MTRQFKILYVWCVSPSAYYFLLEYMLPPPGVLYRRRIFYRNERNVLETITTRETVEGFSDALRLAGLEIISTLDLR